MFNVYVCIIIISSSQCLIMRLVFLFTICDVHLGPLHTRDWEPVTITFQALSYVEKAKEPVRSNLDIDLTF